MWVVLQLNRSFLRYRKFLFHLHSSDERYLGCFKSKLGIDRIFPADNRLISPNMTIQMCIDYCKCSNINYAYAGVEYSAECYCGVANANYSRHGREGDEDCQYLCSGDMTSSCGGTGSIAVFDRKQVSNFV